MGENSCVLLDLEGSDQLYIVHLEGLLLVACL